MALTRSISLWLVALLVQGASAELASSALDGELSKIDADLHLASVERVEQMSSKDLLAAEADAIQKKMDSMDAAIGTLQRSRGALAPVMAHVVTAPSNLRKPMAMLQSKVNATSGSRTGIFGLVEDWKQYWYSTGSPPVRNKLVLALIELVPPLAVMGLDRLYLGQPFMAVMKAFSFFATFGVVGGVWSLCDMFTIATNCLLESKHLDQFGMTAYFAASDYELRGVAALGVLIYLSWFVHFVWLTYYTYTNIQPGGRFYHHYMRMVGGQEVEPVPVVARIVNSKDDPFLTNLETVHKHSLKLDPFLARVPPPAGAFADMDAIEQDQLAQQPVLTPQQKERQNKAWLHHPESALGRWYRHDDF